MVLQQEKENGSKRMKGIITNIYKILAEAEDQQDVLNMLWEVDFREQISRNGRTYSMEIKEF